MVLVDSTSGVSAVTSSLTRSSQNGMVWMMPFDFVAEVRLPIAALWRSSKSEPYGAASTLRGCRLTSWTASSSAVPRCRCAADLSRYSPSLFSRTTTRSMSWGPLR